MAGGLTVFFLMAFLVSLTGVIAQDESGNDRATNNDPPPSQHTPMKYDEHHDRAGFFGLPDFGQLFGGLGGGSSNASDPFSQIASAFLHFVPGSGGSNNSNIFSAFLPHGRSQRIDLLPSDLGANNATEDLTPHDRFFFSLFRPFFNHFFNNNNINSGIAIGCNYTTQAGYSCAGCREQLICNSNNVGRIRICPNNNPYCYNGVCGTLVNSTCTNSTG